MVGMPPAHAPKRGRQLAARQKLTLFAAHVQSSLASIPLTVHPCWIESPPRKLQPVLQEKACGPLPNAHAGSPRQYSMCTPKQGSHRFSWTARPVHHLPVHQHPAAAGPATSGLMQRHLPIVYQAPQMSMCSPSPVHPPQSGQPPPQLLPRWPSAAGCPPPGPHCPAASGCVAAPETRPCSRRRLAGAHFPGCLSRTSAARGQGTVEQAEHACCRGRCLLRVVQRGLGG